MSMNYNDWAAEMAIDELHNEAVMARAALEQAIYLFVEGDSEEIAVPLLLANVLDLAQLGVRIANYNGHGNLRAALRIVRLTLNHERPIIVTYDNDPPSVASLERCERQGLITDLTYRLSLPTEPIVTYPCGHRGGAFEETFPVDAFLECIFRETLVPAEILSERSRFESTFDPAKPWVSQVQQFVAGLGFPAWNTKKTILAQLLAAECRVPPPTYSTLGALIREVRDRHPILHPNSVELPEVPGLTWFPPRGPDI